jgi:hypothetical protein
VTGVPPPNGRNRGAAPRAARRAVVRGEFVMVREGGDPLVRVRVRRSVGAWTGRWVDLCVVGFRPSCQPDGTPLPDRLRAS